MYLNDMRICQDFALLNRVTIAKNILANGMVIYQSSLKSGRDERVLTGIHRPDKERFCDSAVKDQSL